MEKVEGGEGYLNLADPPSLPCVRRKGNQLTLPDNLSQLIQGVESESENGFPLPNSRSGGRADALPLYHQRPGLRYS